MSSESEQKSAAYDLCYVLDNRLALNWYPTRVLEMARKGSMLELGVGHGYSSAIFSKEFSRYLVIDCSQEIIDRFRARFSSENVDIVLSYFEEFDTDERFDTIVMGFILEHVDDPSIIIQKYSRFLAPGGSIFISVPNAESLHRRIGHAAGLLPDIQSLSASDLDFGHKRYFTLDSLRQLVESEGLKVERIEGLLLKPITTQQMLDLKLSESVLQALLEIGVDYPELCNSILLQAGQPQST